MQTSGITDFIFFLSYQNIPAYAWIMFFAALFSFTVLLKNVGHTRSSQKRQEFLIKKNKSDQKLSDQVGPIVSSINTSEIESKQPLMTDVKIFDMERMISYIKSKTDLSSNDSEDLTSIIKMEDKEVQTDDFLFHRICEICERRQSPILTSIPLNESSLENSLTEVLNNSQIKINSDYGIEASDCTNELHFGVDNNEAAEISFNLISSLYKDGLRTPSRWIKSQTKRSKQPEPDRCCNISASDRYVICCKHGISEKQLKRLASDLTFNLIKSENKCPLMSPLTKDMQRYFYCQLQDFTSDDDESSRQDQKILPCNKNLSILNNNNNSQVNITFKKNLTRSKFKKYGMIIPEKPKQKWQK